MARYYFHIREGGVLERDIEGADFACHEDAQQEAMSSAREMVAEAVLRDEIIDGRAFEITAEDDTIIATVPFVSVIRF
ncbi:DUF6894 family protein [Pseudorhizobium marinum]|uniref:DUF6894 family protein n=1 Tax=Pseudorhizobium marinum TaxID=1496690 RepID=UPI000495787D|nr:hypothetical protein [Pseudorhizobium marinum]